MGTTALLLTGRPGIGKTTAIVRAAERLAHLEPRGFLTRELREGGRRVGFELRTLAGARATLAHVGLDSAERVGRYGVDVAALDRVAVPELSIDPPARLYLLDEIGKMECFSGRFVAAVRAILEQRRPLVATVALRGGGLIAEIKRRPDVELVELTRENRDEIPERILDWSTR